MISPLTKYRIKRVIGALGIRVRPGNAGHPDLRSFLRHLRALGFRPSAVFDVGVADGTLELYITFPEARHILVEAMGEFRPALDFLCRRFNATYVIAAAGRENGETQVAYTSDLHASSTLTPNGQSGSSPGSVRSVPLYTLDHLAEENHAVGPFLIKVDTQGSELAVLEGAGRILEDTAVVILETSLFRTHAKRPILDEVIAFMKERGFLPYDFFGTHGRPLDGALTQIDVAFVKADGPFRASQQYISPEQAEAYRNSFISRLRRALRV